YLPAYLPNFNPIELAFSAIKAFVCRIGIIGRADLESEEDDTYVYVHLIDAALPVTAESAMG
ncbi:hypothetical protein DFH08DRAFT_697109, partial [Mycena albidolilacea]